MESQDRSSSASEHQPQQHPENRPFPLGSSFGGMGILPQGKGFGMPGAGGAWPGLSLPGMLPGLSSLGGQGMGGVMPGMGGSIPGLGGMKGLLPGLGGAIPSLGGMSAFKSMKNGSYPWAQAAAGTPLPGVHPASGAMTGYSPIGGQAVQGYPAGSGGYPPPGYPPGGQPQQGWAQPGSPPQGWGAPGTPPQGWAQPGLPPQGWTQPSSPPQGWGAPGTPPQGWAQPGADVPSQPVNSPAIPSATPTSPSGASAPGSLPGQGSGGGITPESIAAWQGVPPGFTEESIPKIIQSIDPNWVSQWENYQGWPFPGPPFPIVPDAVFPNQEAWPSVSTGEWASACSGDLQNPACLQACLAALTLRWQAQEQQLAQAMLQLRQLEARVQLAESKPSYTIEKLEYNFDQLKVEQLDGTLNIGMTTPSEGQMQEFGQLSVPQKTVKGGAPQYPLPIPASAAKGLHAPAGPTAAASNPTAAPAALPLTPAAAPAASAAPPGFSGPPFGQQLNNPALTSNDSGTMAGTTIMPGGAVMPGHGPVFPSTSPQGAEILMPGTPAFPGLPPLQQTGAGAPLGSGLPGAGGPFSPPVPSPVPGFSAAPSSAGAIPPLPAIIPPGETAPAPVNVPPAAGRHQGYSDVKAAVDAYLNTLAQDAMTRAAKELSVHMDAYHQKMVIEDVRRQTPERIRHYMADEDSKQAALPARSRLEPRQLLRKVAERTIRDAELALNAYVDNLAKQPKG